MPEPDNKHSKTGSSGRTDLSVRIKRTGKSLKNSFSDKTQNNFKGLHSSRELGRKRKDSSKTESIGGFFRLLKRKRSVKDNFFQEAKKKDSKQKELGNYAQKTKSRAANQPDVSGAGPSISETRKIWYMRGGIGLVMVLICIFWALNTYFVILDTNSKDGLDMHIDGWGEFKTEASPRLTELKRQIKRLAELDQLEEGEDFSAASSTHSALPVSDNKASGTPEYSSSTVNRLKEAVNEAAQNKTH